MTVKIRNMLILLMVLVSLVPVFYINRSLQNFIRPGQSLFRLLLYFVLALVFIFLYAFLIVIIILKIYPPH